ncbi:30S ribosomal protein S6 [Stratiformator vulcanicus]|uniref:Small ribosomal subunit protein bS6 n=1 Tax=Stratiformator vulcanicus TaxID=2527980 RepID=A0A517R6D4_9PLAN|nr:30S ribosomal protein S6 [Stratiformator vulcanicus]QDT39430.1 30S ribosomal protein S6 [Stratiformator vulcanicus]
MAEETVAEQKVNYYEGMFLVDSAQYATDPDGMTELLVGLIEKAGGEIAAHRAWQDGRLAYEIQGRRKGLHYLLMFTMPTDRLDDLDRACRLNDKVLRQMIIRHPHVLFEAMVNSIDPEATDEESDGSEGSEAADVPDAAVASAE